MANPLFPKLRGGTDESGEAARRDDNIDSVLRPLATRLANTPIMGAAAPSWVRPDLTAGWTQVATPFAKVAYHKDALGYVHLKGLVNNTSGGALATALFTLPIGYRPSETLRFGVLGGLNVNITANGAVTPTAAIGAGNNFEITGVVFLAER
jgi:hypothetical protein